MAKYSVNLSCGHRETVDLFGRGENRELRIAWYEESGLCKECLEKQRIAKRTAEREEAAEDAKEMGLPDLSGTEKQIAWANVIRKKRLEYFTESSKKNMEVIDLIEYAVKSLTSAVDWIDKRNLSDDIFWYNMQQKVDKKKLEEPECSEEEEKDAFEHATMQPEIVLHEGTVEIYVSSDAVKASYRKDDDFIRTVKDLGFFWSSSQKVWEKKISEITGSEVERAAELGNNLLQKGFTVMINDRESREAAVTGNYQPQHMRWITNHTSKSGKYDGWLRIQHDRNEDLFEKSRKIPGSRYDSYFVIVPVKEYLSVIDFSNMHDFKFSASAQKLIDEYKKTMVIVNPAAVKAKSYKNSNEADIMDDDFNVIDDLLDHDN